MDDLSATLKADGSHWKGADHESYVAHTSRENNRNTSQGNGNYVTHALTSEGFDASEDGTGRGTPLIAAPLTSGGHPNSNAPGRRKEDDENLVAHTLNKNYARTTDAAGSHGSGPINIIPFDRAQITSEQNYSSPQPNDPASPLAASGDPHIAYALRRDPGGTGQGHNTNYVADVGVRRLTPSECCKLQGFPMDWFGEPNQPPDGPRYAALGDAVTVSVAEWIGSRLL